MWPLRCYRLRLTIDVRWMYCVCPLGLAVHGCDPSLSDLDTHWKTNVAYSSVMNQCPRVSTLLSNTSCDWIRRWTRGTARFDNYDKLQQRRCKMLCDLIGMSRRDQLNERWQWIASFFWQASCARSESRPTLTPRTILWLLKTVTPLGSEAYSNSHARVSETNADFCEVNFANYVTPMCWRQGKGKYCEITELYAMGHLHKWIFVSLMWQISRFTEHLWKVPQVVNMCR